ncbi:MAG: FAD-dependent oxidoreductase [Solobacterium sp.]|nr:FAD-dependent oxidoreductase [Solobacterium sp.]MCH4205117.1 FAD-dependent oxidoreductase [Solobacterium sp.]MCH4226710.1 FAD-dependent oxidoreductase [Solobacterium sp.]MCH4281961.1 FAD-dependent oxidoreductase [Solobacterium sp.]
MTQNNIDESTEKRAAYCLSCPVPRCENGCPVGNHIRDYIKAIKEKDAVRSAEILYSVNPFPQLTCRLCDYARQCQGHCVRGIKGSPVEIHEIEKYISDANSRNVSAGTANGRSIAIVGAGPASLAAALDLRQAGYQTEIYEKLDRVGGAVYSGIPSYRFDKKYLDEIYEDEKKLGTIFHFGCEVGRDISLKELLDSHDRVLLTSGAQIENTYGLSGEGCEAGLSLLYHLNVEDQAAVYQKKYHRAAVWGGGNVAMDCARSLVRILDEVTVIYRRSEKEMPANRDEIEAAKKEGVKFAFLENIKELRLDEQGRVIGAHCIKMHLGEPDASGRARPIETAGSDYEIPCELVIPAIGQSVSFEIFDADIKKQEGTHVSTMPHVYIAGDAYLGPKTVAACIKDGRDAAAEMMRSF